jgi:hypothetical protein
MLKLSLFAFVTGLALSEQSFVAQANQTPLGERSDQTWLEKYGGQYDQTFSGPLSFSHLPYALCLQDEAALFDIAVLGMPFDTSVSYRTGCGFFSCRFSRTSKYPVTPAHDLARTLFVPEVEDNVQPTAIPCFGEVTHTKLTSLIVEM